MRNGLDAKNLLRFPIRHQVAPTMVNLLRVLPTDRTINGIAHRTLRKTSRRKTVYREFYLSHREKLIDGTFPTDSDIDAIINSDVRRVLLKLDEENAPADHAARLTSDVAEIIIRTGKFTGPNPEVERADREAACLLTDAWMMGVILQACIQAHQDWQAGIANDPLHIPKSQRRTAKPRKGL